MADDPPPPERDPDCLAALGELVAFLDGELAPAQAEAVAAHLAGCASCGAERRALDATWAALDLLTPLEARPAWTEQVERAALGGERAKAGRLVRFGGWRAVAAVAAAGLLAAGLAWLATRPAPEASPVALRPDAPAPRPRPVEPPEVVPPRPEPEDVDELPEVDPPHLALELEVDDEGWEEEEELGPDELSDEELDALAEVFDAELPAALPDELAGLAPEELEVIRNLELLVLLEEGGELDVLEALDLLEQLEEEELDES